ncbi:hypothetical protein NBRC10513_002652 [Rhodotorula toruloides]|uniref:ATP-dependent DNA helicase n=2 Tax=Rhodotorula toruloides TaxID=5286 RepID=A0A0K3CBZ4_RHOTO
MLQPITPTKPATTSRAPTPSWTKADFVPFSPSRTMSSTDSSPVKPFPSPGPTQRRTKEEIERKKEEAMQRLKAKAEEKKRLERQKKREQLAAQSLSKFGFKITVASAGISRYGTGKGGVKKEDSDARSPSPQKPKEWAPDERCSDEQRAVLEQVKAGDNVFFTGSAGVGKSFLLKEVTRLLDHLERPYQVTATTGIAALQISGITIHSFAGIGLGKEAINVLYDRIKRSKEKEKVWLNTRCLIIDEVSMSPADLFTKLNILGKLIRKSNLPFGGMQLIVSGDFFQLPPVPEAFSDMRCMRCDHTHLTKVDLHDACVPYEERAKGVPPADIMRCTDIVKRDGGIIAGCGFERRIRRFAFETEAWAECNFLVMELTKVFRQDHPVFIATLEKIRRGICDDECTRFLANCGAELGKGGNIDIQPTNLYPLRKAVDDENRREFEKLKEQAYTFQALDDSRGAYAESVLGERLANVPPSKTLQLKKGAQVLLLANLDVKNGLVNGSRGVIVDWVDRDAVPLDSDADEPVWPGQTQRKKSAGGGMFGGEEWREKAAELWADKQEVEVFPLVYFATGRQLIIRPHTWCIDIDKHNTVARTQLPLQLAWALTIHKSQGQSLDAVGVRLTSTFEKGQAYVALSRCRKPEGMKIDGFRPGVVMAHPVVTIFYDCIKNKTPFFITAVPPVNPLDFVPDFDPLIDKLTRIFGRPTGPIPPGSAVLAPGQKKPAQAYVNPGAQVVAPPQPYVNPGAQVAAPPPRVGWKELLAQAADAFIGAGGCASATDWKDVDVNKPGFDDASVFTAEAYRVISQATRRKRKSSYSAPPASDVDSDSTGNDTLDSIIIDGVKQEKTGGPSGGGKGKKAKRKRPRKRVGH